jgi:hypothetical protein
MRRKRTLAPRADTEELLRKYREALDLVCDHGLVAPMTWRPLSQIQPTLGLQGYVVEHVRANVDRFRRRYQLRLALGENDGNDEDDLAALSAFSESLPPARSRVWVLLPYLVALAITQVFFSLLGQKAHLNALHDLVGLVDLKPQDISTAGDHLIRSDQHLKVLGVVTFGAAALWVVFRPLMWGFRVKRLILNEPRAIRGREQNFELAKQAKDRDVRGAEERLCTRLGMSAPYSSRLDLWISATILVPWLVIGVGSAATSANQPDSGAVVLTLLIIFVVPVSWRVFRLVRCWVDRLHFHDADLAETRRRQLTISG